MSYKESRKLGQRPGLDASQRVGSQVDGPLTQEVRSSRNSVDPLNLLRVLALYFMVYVTHSLATNPDMVIEKTGLCFLFMGAAWAGVWVLFFLSGYLMGKGFYSKKYALGPAGLRTFYLGRFVRIAPPYLLFLLVMWLFAFPDTFVKSASPAVFVRMLTFTYQGVGGVPPVGATWYVSTIMQLYLLAPLVFLLVRKLSRGKSTVLFTVLVVAGLTVRLTCWYSGANWYSVVYVPSWMNLDLFACGMLMARINPHLSKNSLGKVRRMIRKAMASTALFGLVVYTCFVYREGDRGGDSGMLFLYQYVLPTVYLLVAAFYVLAFDYEHEMPNASLSKSAVLRNPLRLIDWMSGVSYEFYLWHSYMLLTVFTMMGEIYPTRALVAHSVKIIVAGVATLAVAAMMNYLLRPYIQSWRRAVARLSSTDRVSE